MLAVDHGVERRQVAQRVPVLNVPRLVEVIRVLALLADLLRRSDELGYANVIANISADQEASVILHRQMGFVEVGHLVKVGFKFDRWLDVVFMQRATGQGRGNSAAG